MNNIVKYWTTIDLCDNKRYIKIVYNMLCENVLNRPTCKNWCSLLKDMVFTLGFAGVWYSQNVGNAKHFLMSVKQRLKDQFRQN